MLTPRQHTQDCQGPVHARFSKRRERRPGLRERHSVPHSCKTHAHEEKEAPESPRTAFVGHSHFGGISERYTLRAEPKHIPLVSKSITENERNEEVVVSTHYKELTTLESIRRQLSAQPKAQTSSLLPDWLLNLDLNLDVTAADIIPPYESSVKNNSESYISRLKVTIIHEDDQCESEQNELNAIESERCNYHGVIQQHERKYDTDDDRRTKSRQSNYSSDDIISKGPRRYQGDMKVMSMQTGGIRSTPFQPKSKKFINQMITYHHMKFHNKKLKAVKPAVDAKMPSTFHIALDRKKLVEERLSDSWNGSYQSSTPRRTSTPSSSKSSSKKDGNITS